MPTVLPLWSLLRNARVSAGTALRRLLPSGDARTDHLEATVTALQGELRAVSDELKFLRTYHEPMHFRPGTLDKFIYHDVAVENEYRLPERFAPDDVILDIGGHIGSFASACLARGAGRVVVFEAEAGNHALATQNLARYGARVEVRNCAVWRSDERVSVLNFSRSDDASNTGGGRVGAGGSVAVPAVAFDAVVNELTAGGKRIRLLKLDCEGSEYPILYTATTLANIDEILGEYHQVNDNDPRSSGTAMKTFLETHGFHVELQPNPGNPAVGEFFARRTDH